MGQFIGPGPVSRLATLSRLRRLGDEQARSERGIDGLRVCCPQANLTFGMRGQR